MLKKNYNDLEVVNMKCSEISKIYKGFNIEFDEDLSLWWIEVNKEIMSNTDINIIKEKIDEITKITPIKAFYFDVDCCECARYGDLTYCTIIERRDNLVTIADGDYREERDISDMYPKNTKNTTILNNIRDLENKIGEIEKEIDTEIDKLEKLKIDGD